MQISREIDLIRNINASISLEVDQAIAEVRKGIAAVGWPTGKRTFTIFPRRMGNGVKPIKDRCMNHLKKAGWDLEKRLELAQRERPGPIDAAKRLSSGQWFVAEWETGNISSSHRAMNKMMVGLQQGVLLGGALILPTRAFYTYLTDRVGNYEELVPYFSVWKRADVTGVLMIIAVEHDKTSKRVPIIPKGTDGRALV
jgi:hypothetical protein